MTGGSAARGSRPVVEFWYDLASSYSYPAALRLPDAADAAGVDVAWRPFLLGPVFAQWGWRDSPFNLYPVKGRYMWRDLERLCAAHGIPLRRPTRFPRVSALATRLALLGVEQGWAAAFSQAVFTANFVENREIVEEEVLAALLERIDLPAERLLEQARTPALADRLRHQVERAVALDIFGAPSFVVAGELFWGNDRMEPALAWALARSS